MILDCIKMDLKQTLRHRLETQSAQIKYVSAAKVIERCELRKTCITYYIYVCEMDLLSSSTKPKISPTQFEVRQITRINK